jgi:hypothetical protein
MSEISDPFDGFLAAYQAASSMVFERIEEACARPRDWPRRVGEAVGSVLALFTEDPELARLVLFGAYSAGGFAQLRHEEALGRLASLLREGRDWAAAEPPEVLEIGLVGSAVFVVGAALRSGEPRTLADLTPELVVLILTPYVGTDEAERVAAGE